VAALLMIFVAIMIVLGKDWVWLPAIIAAVSSQILIFLFWQDAKFGTIPNIVLFIFAIYTFATWNFHAEIDKETNWLLSKSDQTEPAIIQEQMLAPLPAPVQKWLKHIGLVGKEQIMTACIIQKGEMKLNPDQKEWSKAQVVQYITTSPPGFLWKVKMNMMPIVTVVGRDMFSDGQAAMTIKIASLFPAVNVKNNKKVNQSTLQRYLMELPWYPSAALNPYIAWEEIDEHSAKATMTYKDVTGSATFYFDDSGKFTKVSAMRYKDHDESAEPVECVGEAKEYKIIDGIKIPSKMSITWMLDDGPFTWYRLEIIDARYN
jgi:hypothetical protein